MSGYLVAARRSSLTGGRGRGGRGGDSFGSVSVGSMQPIRQAVIGLIQWGRRVEVLHGAEIFGGNRLKG